MGYPDMNTLKQQSCLRCGHTWWPRQLKRSIRCSKCRSAYWDRPRRDTAENAIESPSQVESTPVRREKPEMGATAPAEDRSLMAALTRLREMKSAGRSWSEMAEELERRFSVRLDKDQLKALIR